VIIGLTVFEISKEAEVRRIDGKYVRVSQLPLADRVSRFATTMWTDTQHMPSGHLGIRVSSAEIGVSWEKQWRETKKGELKPKVRDIAAELEAASPKIVALVEEANRQADIRRREWEAQQEKWRREAEERRRAQNLKESRGELFDIIEAWAAARKTEDFFADVEERVAGAPGNERDLLLSRIREARAMLGGVDALHRFKTWRSPDER